VSPLVLDSALKLFLAFTQCGPRALATAFEAIVSPKLLSETKSDVNSHRFATIAGLKEFLFTLDFNTSVEEDTADLDSSQDLSNKQNTAASSNKKHNLDEMTTNSRASFSSMAGLPGGKANLACDFVWNCPTLFDHVFKGIKSPQKTLAGALIERPVLWPFVLVSGSLLGILANPNLNLGSIKLTLTVLKSACCSTLYPEVCQPAIVDVLSAVFLSMGGGVTLSAIFGRFGSLVDESKDLEFISYLFRRGTDREQYWKLFADSKEQEGNGNRKKSVAGVKEKQKEVKKPAARGKGKGDSKNALIEEPFNLPYEPDDTHPDPNHGPDSKFWASLLSTPYDDEHSKANHTVPLICCMQSGLQDLALLLIRIGVAVNACDNSGRTPLMFALVLSNGEILDALLASGALPDIVDGLGNPTIKYAFFSIPNECVEKLTKIGSDDVSEISFLGNTAYLEKMLGVGVEINVMDALGCCPIHFAVGLGTIMLELGGHSITVNSGVYSETPEKVIGICKRLVAVGAVAGGTNRSGVIPLHVACARGDFPLVQYLIEIGSPLSPNTLDGFGFLPLHFVAACYRPTAKDIIDILIQRGQGRTARKAIFSDNNAGQSKLSKYLSEVDSVLDFILGEASCPTVINGVRLSFMDILSSCTNTNLNCFHLALAGHALDDSPWSLYLSDDEFISGRLDLVMHLLSKVTPVERIPEIVSVVDSQGLTMLHALCLLGKPTGDISELYEHCIAYHIDIDAHCRHNVSKLNLPLEWTPLHAAIARSNYFLVSQLINKGADITISPYVHFLANFDNDDDVTKLIIETAATSPHFNMLLNNENQKSFGRDTDVGTPLHLAVRSEKVNLIKLLMQCKKVNPNAQDSGTGASPLMEACAIGNRKLVEAIMTDRDRVDMLLEDFTGNTCVEIVINTKNIELLEFFISTRRNDVVERLLLDKGGHFPSLLIQLESENIKLSESLAIEMTPIISREVIGDSPHSVKKSISDDQSTASDGMDESVKVITKERFSSLVTTRKRAQSLAVSKTKVQNSNKIVSLVVNAVNSTGIAQADFHAHSCFAEGKLYLNIEE